MKKILLIIIFLFSLFTLVLAPVYADPLGVGGGPTTGFVEDPEVTFVGKAASRADSFLNWALVNYNWLCVNASNCSNQTNNPLIPFWLLILYIVLSLLLLFVLAGAFIIIVTRGRSITIMRFLPRFILIVILVALSFAIVELVINMSDIVQGFFLRVPTSATNATPKLIDSTDLLHVDFGYKSFEGYRLIGSKYDESAYITLVLVRLTAITYYVMTGVLLIRKIILWFFIVISPIFPLLLLYRPIRNTGKIWIGEFFRWLLYGPLFAIFLHGLVVLWRTGIPLSFTQISGAGSLVGQPPSAIPTTFEAYYPTAVNILIGGPKQAVGINNSANLNDTFALYVVSLLMLWVVILLPFLLLKIFLDYVNNVSLAETHPVRKFFSRSNPLNPFGPQSPTPPPPPGTPPPGQTQPTGMARVLPFLRGKAAMVRPVGTGISNTMVKESNEVLRQVNITIPRIRDIARFDTSMVSRDVVRQQEVSRVSKSLQSISNPQLISTPAERERISTVKQKLVTQKDKGNIVASSVLNASTVASNRSQTNMVSAQTSQIQQKTNLKQAIKNIANSNVSNKAASSSNVANMPQTNQKTEIKTKLETAKNQGNQLASEILETSEKIKKATNIKEREIEEKKMDTLVEKIVEEEKKGNKVAKDIMSEVAPIAATQKLTSVVLPQVNRVQQVSIEEFEDVRKMWLENYRTIEPPKDLSGREETREEWINNDLEKVNQAISLLSSTDQLKVNEGMDMVSNILPFLLLGGFSKSEVISYLKAKSEAGKEAMSDIKRKEEEEDTLTDKAATVQKPKEMTIEQTMDVPESTEPNVPTDVLGQDKNKDTKALFEDVSQDQKDIVK